jgi:hypothetical protein
LRPDGIQGRIVIIDKKGSTLIIVDARRFFDPATDEKLGLI